ncbi:amidohydrolase family protein [Rhizobium sp. P32RR-XVIII]|uniref:amidohydrolase family protein n=1 Tax=Rhizobium sp. P32RR-XVIII TaxID=2726738 RepID=UPI001457011C|nr:amidohydrolase family protein [Rhizobium sp. P32RR-XVIII]NLS06079.1 amidohydrolase family protein [Rhizobium sp. P32RR-XVIII]
MTVSGKKLFEPTIPGPDPNTRTPRLRLPAQACDCHAHIFGPQDRYGYDPNRSYTPPDASLEEYLALLDTLGIERGVLVQPSVYGTDNAAMLDGLERTRARLRGVAVIEPDIAHSELERMHDLGIRGCRLNLYYEHGNVDDLAPALAERIAAFGWHLQFYLRPHDLPRLEKTLLRLPTDIVIDHLGQAPVAEGVEADAFQSLHRLVRNGRCWIKLSAPMRMSAQKFPYRDVTPFIHALVDTKPDRTLWGSDWPHPRVGNAMPNDGDLVDLLGEWIPDEAVRNQILVDNPARLYGF